MIEVLIMLAVTAVLAATVLETVRASTSNGLRIEAAARTSAQNYITRASVRRTIEASLADYYDSQYAFEGDENGFRALTSAPATSRWAGAQAYSLRLLNEDSGVSLLYQDSGGTIHLGSWPGGRGQFSYYGETSANTFDFLQTTLNQPRNNGWVENWPERSLRRTSQEEDGYYQDLPFAVRILIELENGQREVIIYQFAITAPPIPRMSDVLGAFEP